MRCHVFYRNLTDKLPGVTVTLGDDVKLSATIVLEKAVDTALFQVVTTDQKPIEGATITVEGIETPQVTDASGYVWFTLPIEYFSGKETHYAVTKEGYVKCTGSYKFTEAMVACVVVLEVDPGSGIVGVESGSLSKYSGFRLFRCSVCDVHPVNAIVMAMATSTFSPTQPRCACVIWCSESPTPIRLPALWPTK